MTLLEAARRKCDWLERWTAELPNLRVVCGRAEEQPLERYGVAVAKALAHPPTAAEWCLPLVHEGGAAILWVGPSVDLDGLAAVAEMLAARLESASDGLVLLRKTGPTPSRFPRRAGIARKRPLG
jgi:16S rRNA (guanine527-N7)-methyltransferase